MDIESLLNWIQSTELAVFIQLSGWAFPTIEAFHVISIALVFGVIAIVDLRLLGVASGDRRISEVTQDCLRWTWLAFGIAVVTGGLMFISNATVYFDNIWFRWKMVLMACAGINMMIFELVTARSMVKWDDGTAAIPVAGRVAGLLSLGFWIGVIACGRWIGFTLYDLPI